MRSVRTSILVHSSCPPSGARRSSGTPRNPSGKGHVKCAVFQNTTVHEHVVVTERPEPLSEDEALGLRLQQRNEDIGVMEFGFQMRYERGLLHDLGKGHLEKHMTANTVQYCSFA